MLSEPTVQELRQILKEDYGLNVSFEEALEIANTLTSYYELVLKVYARQAGEKASPEKVDHDGNNRLHK